MIRAQLHDGTVLHFSPDTPDEKIDAAVARHLAATNGPDVARELAAIRKAVEAGAGRIIEAITAPRETVLETDFAGKPKKSVTKLKGN
jgi:hypothetical protein